jgi:hypothetical protein
MTVTEAVTEILSRAGQPTDGSGYYSRSAALKAYNRAQRDFSFLTGCYERTTTLSVAAALSTPIALADFIAPLRCQHTSGARVFPQRFREAAAVHDQWITVVGAIERYQVLAGAVFVPYPRPATSTNLTLWYMAYAPYQAEGNSPVVPIEYHDVIADMGVLWLRAAEGGQEFGKVVPGIVGRWVLAVSQCRGRIAQRLRQQSADTIPFEDRKHRHGTR